MADPADQFEPARIVERWSNATGKFERTKFHALAAGDVIRIFEPNGSPVNGGEYYTVQDAPFRPVTEWQHFVHAGPGPLRGTTLKPPEPKTYGEWTVNCVPYKGPQMARVRARPT